MPVSENEFELIQGNSYRGSRYSNFVGGGIDPVGNVSSGVTENQANAVGTSADTSQRQIAPGATRSAAAESPSENLVGGLPSTSELVIGTALPYAGSTIGKAAGAAFGSGAASSVGEAAKIGVSHLANKVSGGLIGTAASPTNLAIQSSLKGAAGPATQSAVNAASKASNVASAGSGASTGAALGSGFATAAATLLTTGDVKEAAKAGVGTAIGTKIGFAVGGPIGGFIGGFVGGLFCFSADTPILMADGTSKNIQDIKIGEQVLYGGLVIAAGQAMADDIYEYKNTRVTSFHAVFEDGQWLRAAQSDEAVKVAIEGAYEVVYPIATENHILLTPWFISRDLLELDEEDGNGLTSDEIIEFLNDDSEEIAQLIQIERELKNGQSKLVA